MRIDIRVEMRIETHWRGEPERDGTYAAVAAVRTVRQDSQEMIDCAPVGNVAQRDRRPFGLVYGVESARRGSPDGGKAP